MSVTERQGNWMQTAGGRAFFPLDPRPEDVDIGDIAHALAFVCRFGGHCNKFYCPTPDQRVLTADLQWVPAGDLRVGQELVGFDEQPHEIGATGKKRRRFRHSVVTAAQSILRRVMRLEMSDGSSICSSVEHPWLVATKLSRNQKWQTTEQIAEAVTAGRKRYLHRFIKPWRFEGAREAGWLAGMYDGEGYLSAANRRGTQLGVSQKHGPVLDELSRILTSLGFSSVGSQTGLPTSGVQTLQMLGGWREIVRLLGSVRPMRLLSKFQEFLRCGEFDKQLDGVGAPLQIVRAYDEGMRECSGLETSTHTYICEGFGAHNSVAEHSVRVSLAIADAGGTRAESLAGLLHDAAEAYVGDMVWPLKQAAELFEYKSIERNIERVIAERFDVTFDWPIIKRFDLVLLSTEKRDLMGNDRGRNSPREVEAAKDRLGGWHSDAFEPLSVRIDPWSPAVAKAYFLTRFDNLGGVR